MKITTTIIVLLYFISHCVNAQDYDILADIQNGCDSLTVNFTLSDPGGNATSANWDFGNGNNHNGLVPPSIKYSTTGVYTVSVVVNGSDEIIKSDFIGVYPQPKSRIFINDSILSGSYYVAFTIPEQDNPFDTVNYYYNWDFGDGTTFTTNNRQHGHRYPDEGTYYISLNIFDNYGCSVSNIDTVIVQDRFNVGNIFTPNNDNINDVFYIETNGLTIYSLLIFTRTGNMVYKTESPLLEWDGRNNAGVKMAPGLYYYIVQEINGTHNQTGFFYMLY